MRVVPSAPGLVWEGSEFIVLARRALVPLSPTSFCFSFPKGPLKTRCHILHPYRSAATGKASAIRIGIRQRRRAMEEGLVSVDKFSGGSQAYFLTHLHQDHTRGLGAAGGWRHGPLYCSPTTARLLPSRFPGIDASVVRPLAPGASASISLSSPSGQPLSVRVTAIPALHCPGTSPLLIHCFLYTTGTELHWPSPGFRGRCVPPRRIAHVPLPRRPRVPAVHGGFPVGTRVR